jgi:uncharacterized lipoprotein YddW (UPF0748 family)
MKSIRKWIVLFIITGLTMMNPFVQEGAAARKNRKEVRAVWLHQTKFDRDETIARQQITALFDDYKQTGINNLYCYYTLQEENRLSWDYLKVIIDEGHKRGIGIHPIFCPGHEINLEQALKEHPGWLIRDLNGKPYPSYNPALPAVRKFWMEKISKALEYDIDGIHLDYIRYPVNQRFSYDSLTCTLFKQEYGSSPLDVSHDSGSMIWCEWIRWNERRIMVFVREIHDLIRKSGKKIQLGADVFPDTAISPVEIGQNWGEWAREGIIDFVCPMFYTNNQELFTEYLGKANKLAGKKCSVYPGIGIVTSHNKITKEILLEEVLISQKTGVRGVVFFSGNSLDEGFRSVLKPILTGD